MPIIYEELNALLLLLLSISMPALTALTTSGRYDIKQLLQIISQIPRDKMHKDNL